MKEGLPQQLKKETGEALKPIYQKYMAMKKSHMGRDRIIGIMYRAFKETLIDTTPEKADWLHKMIDAGK